MTSRVIKNASWIIACKIAQSLINLVIGMITARYLGPSNYGLISYASSVVAFAVPLMQLGLSKTLVQDLLEHPDREGEVLGTALFMNLLSAVACMGGVYIFLRYSNAGDELAILVGVLFSSSLLFQATEVVQYWFQAKLLSKYTSLVSLAAYFSMACYKTFLLITQKPVTWFAVANSLDYMLISAALIVLYNRLGKQPLRISLRLGRKMLHRSKHYIISAMMVTIFAQTDRIMLKHMIGEAETGFYSAAIGCIGVTAFVFAAIIDSMRPSILEAKKENSPSYEMQMVQLYSLVTYLALAQSLGMTLLAKPLVLILYGADYINSIPALRIGVWYTTFSYYGTVRNIWILAEGKQRYLWIINLSGATLNVAINFLLIPSLGAVGAATASLITQIFTNVLIGYLIRPIRKNNEFMLRGLHPRAALSSVRDIVRSLTI